MAAVFFALGAHAQEGLSLGAGVHYSQGNYGTDTTTRISTLAATARYETGPWVYRAYVPYIQVKGDNSVIPGVGTVRGGAGEVSSESGLGDIVLAATHTAHYNPATTFGVELTGKVKLPTADEARGLGTGEADYSFHLDLYKTFDRVTPFGGVGFHILGDAPGLPLRNVWSSTVGFSYKADERDSYGLSLDGRERVAAGASPQRELIGFWVRKFDQLWKMQLYGLIGLADGSPDWGFGLSLARPF